MSNYNDLEPLISNPNIHVDFISSNVTLEHYAQVILPGSKLVMKDLQWLKNVGIFEQLQRRKKEILGICGGYQMMFKNIHDPHAIEAEKPMSVQALGFIDDDITFQKEKILKKTKYSIFATEFIGFEIHHGISLKYPLYYERNNIKGTFVHGLFEDEYFKTYKKKTINNFVNIMKKKLDVERILKSVC